MLRKTVTLLATLTCVVFLLAQDKKAPDKLKFAAKTGAVTFDHAQHAKAAKNDCKVCHDKLWPQDGKESPLNFKTAMHKPAEAAKTSCGACHHAGGSSFESKGNCNRCHVKGDAKKG
ncbi:MAG: cytochrome c3 family protein [Bryobacteraceae bacterium]|nr:cytochrome c3 family protein [Bryobacteraceae bacterium]